MLLKKATLLDNKTISICGSKSISNRLLILNHLFQNLTISNLSNAQDTQLLQNALESKEETIDIHHAGTAMRFLTSYFSIQEGKTTILTGSSRMKERPINDLVVALNDLRASIEYLEKTGFPPIKIKGKILTKNRIEIPGNTSSQFISSLLLIAAKLENGLTLELKNKITSRSYIQMTLDILSKIGVQYTFIDKTITVLPLQNTLPNTHFNIESDWSSASYFYSFAALAKKSIVLKSLYKNSTQGDLAISKIFQENFGIDSIFEDETGTVTLIPNVGFIYPKKINLEMNNCPDIAQTVCVTAAALKLDFHITGLETLKVKETDRLLALQKELRKIGANAIITDKEISCNSYHNPDENIVIETYNDHRMAMSFAPFCLLKDITLLNEEVVEKSYPNFWKDLSTILKSDN